MVEMKLIRDAWYCYFPSFEILGEIPWDYKILLSEEEERWVVEAYNEFSEVQKFIAGKLSVPKQLELPLKDTTNE